MSRAKNYRKFLVWVIYSIVILSIVITLIYKGRKSADEIDKPIYLWSKRVFDVSDYNLLGTEHISKPDVIADQIKSHKEVVWIRNTSSNSGKLTDLDYFGELLDLIEEPVILVTSDGDRDVPSSYDPNLVQRILSSPKIKKWYTQNYDRSIIHPKLGYYPIGLDMHYSLQDKDPKKSFGISGLFESSAELRIKKFNYYLATRDKYQNSKKNKIFCDSHLSTTHPRRKEMFEILKNNPLIEFQNTRVHYSDIIEKYAQYRFILSPRGNGLDCHRTWEVLLLGSIVITESSSLDDMFIKNDLPVIILKDFNELNNITEEQLEKWYNENKHKTDRAKILQKFDPKYWIEQ
ncbi:MAG: hypothetical protein RLZZ59_629 [Pseudomonadota bacterium]|jgi:hypothetical protein